MVYLRMFHLTARKESLLISIRRTTGTLSLDYRCAEAFSSNYTPEQTRWLCGFVRPVTENKLETVKQKVPTGNKECLGRL